jgi:hypothetical protein
MVKGSLIPSDLKYQTLIFCNEMIIDIIFIEYNIMQAFHIITPITAWGNKKTKDQELRERQDEEALFARLMYEAAQAHTAEENAQSMQAGPFGFYNSTRDATSNFSATTTGDAPYTVQFFSLASDLTKTYSNFVWNFGDGTTGEGPSPIHTYANTGSYTPTLYLSNKSQPFVKTTTTSKSNYISASLPTVNVNFTVIPASRTGSAPLSVTLTDISTVISSTGTNTIRWTLSGSIPGTSVVVGTTSPFSTTLTSGSWNVKLEETGSWGLSGVSFRIGYITSSI